MADRMIEGVPAGLAREIVRVFAAGNGYFRTPNVEPDEPREATYKKGWEARFPVADQDEATALVDLLREAGFEPGKPWLKAAKIVVPVYGRDPVTRLMRLVEM